MRRTQGKLELNERSGTAAKVYYLGQFLGLLRRLAAHPQKSWKGPNPLVEISFRLYRMTRPLHIGTTDKINKVFRTHVAKWNHHCRPQDMKQ